MSRRSSFLFFGLPTFPCRLLEILDLATLLPFLFPTALLFEESLNLLHTLQRVSCRHPAGASLAHFARHPLDATFEPPDALDAATVKSGNLRLSLPQRCGTGDWSKLTGIRTIVLIPLAVSVNGVVHGAARGDVSLLKTTQRPPERLYLVTHFLQARTPPGVELMEAGDVALVDRLFVFRIRLLVHVLIDVFGALLVAIFVVAVGMIRG